MNNKEIVSKLWKLCDVLRDDGITYHQYVTELTYILFLKMSKETGTEDKIPEKYRWDKLVAKKGIELKHFYKDYHNYYYLPKEDRAIHKSVGCYVERQYRRTAKASTCYVKKEGIFLPLPKVQKHFGIQIENYPYEKAFPVYKKEYKELRRFAEFDDIFSEKNVGIAAYLRDVIKELLITRMEENL